MRLDLVIRTSHRKQGGQSPAQQRQQADMICAAGGHTIAAVHDSAVSESGKTMERAALAAATRRIQAGETDGIVVGYLDRLGRAPIEESMAFVRELVGDGGVLVAADWGPEPIDLTDPSTETMLVIRMQMNREQWTKATARYRLSQRNAVEAGKFVGPTPFGYSRRAGRLYEHPARGPMVRQAYRLAERDGLAAAVDHLRAAAPGRKWNSDSVRKLLASHAYLGWSRVVHDDETLLNEDAHAALCDSPAQWRAAQSAARSRRSSGDYPLSHLVRCASCGEGLVGALQTVRGRTYRRMRCSAVCQGGVGSVSADGLEAHVRSLAAAWVDRTGWLASYVPTDTDALTERLTAAEYDLASYHDGVSGLSGELIRRGIDKRQRAVDSLRAELREIGAAARRSELLPDAEQVRTDDAALAAVLRAGLDSGVVVRVAGGRLPIDRRVEVDGLQQGVGVLAA